MKRFMLVTASMIALSTTIASPALALNDRFGDAREDTINRLNDRFGDAREDTINRLNSRFGDAYKDNLDR
jgi:hypothetical protein